MLAKIVTQLATGEDFIKISDLIKWLLDEKRNGKYSNETRDFIDLQIERLLSLH